MQRTTCNSKPTTVNAWKVQNFEALQTSSSDQAQQVQGSFTLMRNYSSLNNIIESNQRTMCVCILNMFNLQYFSFIGTNPSCLVWVFSVLMTHLKIYTWLSVHTENPFNSPQLPVVYYARVLFFSPHRARLLSRPGAGPPGGSAGFTFARALG